MLDWIKKSNETNLHLIKSCMDVTIPLAFLATPLVIIVFWVDDPYAFALLIFFAQILIFAQVGPINNALCWTVPVNYQAFSMAMASIAIHLGLLRLHIV